MTNSVLIVCLLAYHLHTSASILGLIRDEREERRPDRGSEHEEGISIQVDFSAALITSIPSRSHASREKVFQFDEFPKALRDRIILRRVMFVDAYFVQEL